MIRFVLLLSLSCAAAGCGSKDAGNSNTVAPGTPSNEWNTTAAKSQTFQVDLPGGVAVRQNETKTMPGEVGPIKVHMISAEAGDGLAFAAMQTLAKPGPGKQPSADETVAKVAEQLGKKYGGTITKREKIRLDKMPGLEIEFTGVNNTKGVARIFYGNGMLVQNAVYGPASSPHLAHATKFLDSFKLTTPPDPAQIHAEKERQNAERARQEAERLEKSLEGKPGGAVVLSSAANNWRIAGDPEKARSLLKRAAAIGPEYPEPVNNAGQHKAIGRVYLELGDYAEAIEQFEKGLKRDPGGAMTDNLTELLEKAKAGVKANEAKK